MSNVCDVRYVLDVDGAIGPVEGAYNIPHITTRSGEEEHGERREICISEMVAAPGGHTIGFSERVRVRSTQIAENVMVNDGATFCVAYLREMKILLVVFNRLFDWLKDNTSRRDGK